MCRLPRHYRGPSLVTPHLCIHVPCCLSQPNTPMHSDTPATAPWPKLPYITSLISTIWRTYIPLCTLLGELSQCIRFLLYIAIYRNGKLYLVCFYLSLNVEARDTTRLSQVPSVLTLQAGVFGQVSLIAYFTAMEISHPPASLERGI